LTGATGARRNPLFIKEFFLTVLTGMGECGWSRRNPLFIKGFFLTPASETLPPQCFIDPFPVTSDFPHFPALIAPLFRVVKERFIRSFQGLMRIL
jgi:hypothetical protein